MSEKGGLHGRQRPNISERNLSITTDNQTCPKMAGSLPFRPHDDPDQDVHEDGENDDEEEDVDETVCSDGRL